MKKLMMIGLIGLAGCVEARTQEGCKIYASEMMRAYTEACQRAYYEERARQTGGAITRCFREGGQTTCVSE